MSGHTPRISSKHHLFDLSWVVVKEVPSARTAVPSGYDARKIATQRFLHRVREVADDRPRMFGAATVMAESLQEVIGEEQDHSATQWLKMGKI